MMKYTTLLALMVVGSAVVVGCGKTEATATTDEQNNYANPAKSPPPQATMGGPPPEAKTGGAGASMAGGQAPTGGGGSGTPAPAGGK